MSFHLRRKIWRIRIVISGMMKLTQKKKALLCNKSRTFFVQKKGRFRFEIFLFYQRSHFLPGLIAMSSANDLCSS